MYVAVLYVPILRNTIFEERSLFWRDSPYFGGTILFWRNSPYFGGTVLFWRDSSYFGGKVLIFEGQSLFNFFVPLSGGFLPLFMGKKSIRIVCKYKFYNQCNSF